MCASKKNISKIAPKATVLSSSEAAKVTGGLAMAGRVQCPYCFGYGGGDHMFTCSKRT